MLGEIKESTIPKCYHLEFHSESTGEMGWFVPCWAPTAIRARFWMGHMEKMEMTGCVGWNQHGKHDREGSEEKKQPPSSLAMRQSPQSDNYLLEHTRRDIQHPRIGSKWEDGVGWEVTCTRETLPPIQAQWHSLEMSPNYTALGQLGKLLTESTPILELSANP